MVNQLVDWLKFLANDPELVKAWGPIAIGTLSIFVGFVTTLVLLRTQRVQNRYQNEANIRQFNLVKSKEERDEIIKKLNSFTDLLKSSGLNRDSCTTNGPQA
jgi:hypothetical protein